MEPVIEDNNSPNQKSKQNTNRSSNQSSNQKTSDETSQEAKVNTNQQASRNDIAKIHQSENQKDSQKDNQNNRQNSDRFILLRKIKYGEADLILHALSPRGEKLSFIARGALRSKKRFGGGILEPSHYVNLSYKVAAHQGQLNVLEEATLVHDFAGIRKDYDKLDLALHILECVSKVSQEGDQDSAPLFSLLGNSLRAVEVVQDVLVLKMHFYLKFLLQQGVITPEPWMAVFLKTKLSEVNSLINQREIVDDQLVHVEAMVNHYLQHATL